MVTINIMDFFDLARQAMEESSPSVEAEVYTSLKCSHCNGRMVENSETDMVCSECGLVDSTNGRIDQGADWSSGVTDEGAKDGSRVGMAANPLYNTWGLGSKIAKTRGMTTQQKRMAKIDFHLSSNHKDRALHQSYLDIQESCAALGISTSTIELAKCFYKRISTKGITRGVVRIGMKANCVYYACKREGVPRTLHEIAGAFGIEPKDISRVANKFRDCLDEEDTEERVTMASDMIPRLMSEIRPMTPGKIIYKIVNLCKKIERTTDFMGKVSGGVAGACILYSLQDVDIERIIEATNVSKITLTKLKQKIDIMEKVLIWTDGSCLKNPGPGGWGVFIKDGEQTHELAKGVTETTNNRMEIQAAIEAVRWWKEHRPDKEVIIHTDSRYVKDGISKWIESWKTRDFKDVKNDDLWRVLNDINSPMIEWKWVKAHAGNPENEKADKLAHDQALKQKEILKG
jgi:transcription initiation factor TFIIB